MSTETAREGPEIPVAPPEAVLPAVRAPADLALTIVQMRAGERIACLMPLFHTAQLNGFGTPAVMMGATQYLLRGFDPDALLELIENERIERMFALPMMARRSSTMHTLPWMYTCSVVSTSPRNLPQLRREKTAM